MSTPKAGVKALLPEIEVWPNQYRTGYEIEIEMPEFTSICPKNRPPGSWRLDPALHSRPNCVSS